MGRRYCIACRDVEMMNDTKQLLSQRFKMTDMGQLSLVLGIEFVINKDCIMMKQTSYNNNNNNNNNNNTLFQTIVHMDNKKKKIQC